MSRARFFASVTAGLLTFAAFAQPAAANPLVVLGDTLTTYGVVTFGDFGSAQNPYYSDSYGPMAIGGNANIRDFYGAAVTNNGVNALTVGGDLNVQRARFGGNVFVSGNANFAVDYTATTGTGGTSQGATIDGGLTVNGTVVNAPTQYQGTIQTGGTNPVDFAGLRTDAINASNLLAQGTGGTVGNIVFDNWYAQGSSGYELDLNGSSSGINIFNLSSDILGQIGGVNADYSDGGGSFHFNIPTGATAIINVSGTNVDFGHPGNFGFFCGYDSEGHWLNCDQNFGANVLFNFYEAQTLDMQTVIGSILAPLADISFTNGHVDGSVIANSITNPLAGVYGGGAEYHDVVFAGDLGSVPVPNSLLLMLAGLIALVTFGRRRTAIQAKI